jgi:hypothetical protein
MTFLITAIILINGHHSPIPNLTLRIIGAMSIVLQREDSKQRAQQIWDQAVAAKGGRARLYGIRNIVVSSKAKYTHQRKSYPINQEQLIVFPGKSWHWNDLRPDVFGLRVEMFNYETNMHYIVSPDDPHPVPEQIRGRKRGPEELFLYAQVLNLFETKWFKPTLNDATTETVGGHEADVVQSRVLERRIDFIFDRQFHLLIRARIYHIRNNKEVLDDCIDLTDYADVSGINVAQTIKYDDGMEYRQTLQLNVEFDPEVFLRPTSIEAGPGAWRPKSHE